MSGATLPFVEERYESELTRAAAVLDGVDRALERLSEGTYGQCETCGAPVLEADLERDPTRRMCEQHLTSPDGQRRRDRRRRRRVRPAERQPAIVSFLAASRRPATSGQLTTFHSAAKKSAFTFLYCR